MVQSQIDAWIAAMPMAALFIDENARIVAINDSASALLGHDFKGRNYITAVRQPAVLKCIEDCFEKQTPQLTRVVRTEGASDTEFELRGNYVADVFKGVLVTFLDVTEMQKTNLLHRDFVANVSHELRTPLTALMGFIETLQGPAKNDPKASARFLGIMGNETARMNRLVDDLLSLSRVEAQSRQRPTDEVKLNALLNSVVNTFEAVAMETAAKIRLELSETAPRILGAEDQLRQVFSNLIENALKYGGQGVEVTIDATRIEQDARLRVPCIRISVRDTGQGFDPIHISRLTERFYRIDSHRSREMGGTGLGLAIVKHIISRHRGRFEITSKPSQGSEFIVILPVFSGEDT